ncbi:MAG: EamA family transporter RarD [Anaerolineales bacterium]|jgi:chloramphenicol-sensitive protein RarD|nr:EamA family transporter RarD [Anaerolineales bacterium]
MNRGVWYAVGAYLLWGLLPVYWKALQTVPALQILNHRVVWSLVFLAAILFFRRDWEPLRQALKSRRIVWIYLATSCLLGVNWLTYIWGVNAGFIVETSLGYFINPLVSVLLGVVFLREKLRAGQWLPVGLAALGVVYLTISYQKLPWIALVLAFTFGLYGLIKKIAPLGSLHSLALETALLFVPSLAYLLWAEVQGSGAFGHVETGTTLLLVFTGVVTALPLLLFGAGARLIPLSLIGLLQYLAPTLQFLIGVLIYGEPFTRDRMIGFGIIWIALVIYTLEGVLTKQRQRS